MFRELVDGPEHLVVHDAVEEGSLWVVVLDLLEDREGLDRVDVHGLGVPGAAAVFINESVPQDRQQPALGVGAPLELMPGAVRLEHGLLDQVVGFRRIAGEPQRHPVQAVEMDQRLALEARPLLGVGRRRGGGRGSRGRGGRWWGRGAGWDGRRHGVP